MNRDMQNDTDRDIVDFGRATDVTQGAGGASQDQPLGQNHFGIIDE